MKVFLLSYWNFAGKTEIRYLKTEFTRISVNEKEILNFKITMNYPLAVQKVDTLQNLINNESSFSLTKGLAAY